MKSTFVGKKIEVTDFCEVSITSRLTVQHYIPEDRNQSCHFHGNLIFCICTPKFLEFGTKR